MMRQYEFQPEGIFVSDFEQGEIGPDLFLHACKFGLEGLARADGVGRAFRPIRCALHACYRDQNFIIKAGDAGVASH